MADKSPRRIHDKLQIERTRLPIYCARSRLIQEVQSRNTVIIIGETGSGKTTQLPQYLFEENVNRGAIIGVTQPRRVAAITISQRVAQEKSCEIGNKVGYCVRFDDMCTDVTKIKYMTDGMLLREAILDPLLRRYSIVILDEAHERTVHTDVLFGVIKAAQKQRVKRILKPLKVVVMSATMDVDHFSRYFNNARVLYLEGRQHSIQLMYAVQPQTDYLLASLTTFFQIHRAEPAQKDVLLFLTGQEEIDSTVRSIRDVANELTDAPKLMVCPLYAALPPQHQLRVFQPTPKECRKVIVATNIAETSVTIKGISFVIDSGMVKAKTHNAKTGLDMMKVVRVSQAQANQRTGRAGRESPGTCFRLYTLQEFEQFSKNTVPEIQRCNLSSVFLQLLAMGIPDVTNFDFMDKPSREAMQGAIEELELLGAVEQLEDKVKLTALGKKMSAFPLDPKFSKVIMSAKDHHCLEEILSIVSVLSVDSVLFTPVSKRDEAVERRRKFQSFDGDHLTLLNIFQAYKAASGNKRWCHENFINSRNMSAAVDVRQQLKEICKSQDLKLESCGQDTVVVRKCLATGFFMNTAELQREGEYISLSSRKPVVIHPSSMLFRCKPAYVLYNELVKTTKCYMRDLSVVDAEWLYDVAPEYFRKKKPGG